MGKRSKFVDRTGEVRMPFDRTWARVEFFRALRRVAPEVVSDLKRRLIPQHTGLIPTGDRARRLFLVDHDAQEVALAALGPVIREWGDEHHLTQPDEDLPYKTDYGEEDIRLRGCTLLEWVGSLVLRSLMDWVIDGRDPPDWVFPDVFSLGAHMDMPERFVFEADGWASLRESKIDFVKRVSASFEAAIEAYVRSEVDGSGSFIEGRFYPYPALPERSTKGHFDWLVLYKVKGLAKQAISRRYRDDANVAVSRQAVKKGIDLAAEHVIGPLSRLWLRRTDTGPTAADSE